MAFNATAISALYSQVVSKAQASGEWGVVVQHEPKAAPVTMPALAVWWAGIGPARGVSGLAATSARCEFKARAYLSYRGKPEDQIDPHLILLASDLIAELSGGYTLAGDVMEVDLLGAYGTPLEATAGYIVHDDQQFRVAELTIPVIIDGIWTQGA